MHVLYETTKQLAQAALVYVFLIFGYSQVSEAVTCGAFINYYMAGSSGAANTTQVPVFRSFATDFTPDNCGDFIMTGTEYVNLIKGPLNTAAINITTLQANTQTLQSNIQTVNNSLQTVAELAADSRTRIEVLEAQFQTQGLRDSDNILHINHDDAMTLFYAVMGLFATAFVWRYARNSFNVGETYTVTE